MNKIEKLIQQHLNRELQYGIKIIQIVGYDYDVDRGRVYLHTNEKERHFDRGEDDIPDFFKQFQIVRKTDIVQASPADALIATAANADKLKAILMDNIEKVQSDPTYIKQATAINNNVNSIINITKMQLDYAKAASKMK